MGKLGELYETLLQIRSGTHVEWSFDEWAYELFHYDDEEPFPGDKIWGFTFGPFTFIIGFYDVGK